MEKGGVERFSLFFTENCNVVDCFLDYTLYHYVHEKWQAMFFC